MTDCRTSTLLPIGVELLGDDHRQRRLHALADLGVLREQHDRAVGADLHVRVQVRVGRGLRLRERLLGRGPERQREHEAAAGETRELDEAAARELQRFLDVASRTASAWTPADRRSWLAPDRGGWTRGAISGPDLRGDRKACGLAAPRPSDYVATVVGGRLAMRQSWRARRCRGALGAVLVGGVLLSATPGHAQPAMSCDAASFAKLGLPATRIVSAATVQRRRARRAALRAARRGQRAHGHGRQAVRDRFRDAAARELERPLLRPGQRRQRRRRRARVRQPAGGNRPTTRSRAATRC